MLIFFLLAPSIFTYVPPQPQFETRKLLTGAEFWMLNKHELCFIINQNPIADQNLI